uniref:Uncharacterized protein n=1 Tax=Parascaris equorum TaxID=6256 RepID=A0A914RAR1_PAREQ
MKVQAILLQAPSKYVLFAGLFALLIGIVFVAVLMGIYVTAVEDTAENVDELGNITISVGTGELTTNAIIPSCQL